LSRKYLRPDSPNTTSSEILAFLKSAPDQTATLSEMAQGLNVSADGHKDLRRVLRALIDERKLVKLDRRHFGLPPKGKVVEGRFQAHREGFGFLIPDDPSLPDIFLGKRDARELMHRDRLAVHLGKKRQRGEGAERKVEVLERASRRVVGRYQEGTKHDLVLPDDPRQIRDLRIPKKSGGGAKENQLVLAEITRYPTPTDGAEGRVLKVLGDSDDPRLDAEIIIFKFDLPDAFPGEVLKEAEDVPQAISRETLFLRRDLRDLNFFTVDGETARDFDDAVALRRQKNGNFKLWVAIADVSHYVREGSALDKEAFRRGTSVYFPERALPMLPPQLSNGICSLNPREDRLTVTAEMDFNAQGVLQKVDLFPSIIHSRERLTYTLVRKVVEEEKPGLGEVSPAVAEDLLAMAALCRLIRARRMAQGSIDFDLPESEVILDVQGRIEEIVRADRHIGHQMIEEFMIAANEAVGRFLAEREAPSLNRIHEPPERVKIEAFAEFLSHLGYPFPVKEKIRPALFQRILDKVRGKAEEKPVNYLLLRSMKQARYSEKTLGHFALGKKHYLHFTSPIRRYPDLIVHRILKEILSLSGEMRERRRERWAKKLPSIAEQSSERERIAMEAEREIVNRKKVKFMRGKIGEEFNGYISAVVSFGIFVELEGFFIDGLVHITRLPPDQYRFFEKRHTLLGEHTRKAFRLGDRVRVRVDAASLERKQVDFSLIQ
jgi:ribonuclease R